MMTGYWYLVVSTHSYYALKDHKVAKKLEI